MIAGRLFRPSCAITIGAVAVQDLNIPLGPRGPRMAFKVTKTLTQEPDSAEFSIYNLDEALETSAVAFWHELGKLPVTLSAGYEGAVSYIFRGDLRDLTPGEQVGADFMLRGLADDGGDAFSELTVSMSSAGVTAEVMIQIALAKLNAGDPVQGILPYPVAPHQSVAQAIAQVVPSARAAVFDHVHIGKVTDLLNEAARILSVRWWIADGLLYLAKRKQPVDGLVVVVPSPAWLSKPRPAGNGLTQFDAVYDPLLIPGRIVQIVEGPSKYALGVGVQTLRCEAVTITGDTRGSDPWRASMFLRRPGPL